MTEEPFVFRGLEPDADLPRLVRLMAEVEAVDRTGEDISAEALRGLLDVPGHDSRRDRWVVEDPENSGHLIAHSLLLKSPAGDGADATGAVHPAWRRRGIGSELLHRTIARAQELHARHLTVYADSRNQESDLFVCKRGFQPVAAYTEMSATLDAPLPPPDTPEGPPI